MSLDQKLFAFVIILHYLVPLPLKLFGEYRERESEQNVGIRRNLCREKKILLVELSCTAKIKSWEKRDKISFW